MERRLAAILAADVVGYSRLMEADEVETLAALKERRRSILTPLVARHRGRIVKVMGDGVLVEFASAVNAVQCAIDIQHAMASANGETPADRAIVLRIGVNLGDVIVEGGDLYGDGVNIAARLEAMAEPGGILVAGPIHDQVKNKLDLAFEDLGSQALKNLSEPVRIYRAAIVEKGLAPDAQRRSEPLPLPAKPSIAVLPFANLSDDAGQAYFADGMSEDIITDLSKVSGLFVIARNTSFSYKGKAVKTGEVSRELGVRYVLEGSVRKAGNRVRITAQLIDGGTGGHLWADRYDRDLTDVFAVQDEITGQIVSALAVTLTTDEKKRLRQKDTENLEAYDHYLRGSNELWKFTREGCAEARRLLQAAIELDPRLTRAYAILSHAHLLDYVNRWHEPPEDSLARALELAERAVALDADDSMAQWQLGSTLLWLRQHDRALAALRRAVALDPNFAAAHASLGHALSFAGRPEDALEPLLAAIRLNPLASNVWLHFLAEAQFGLKRYEDAAATLRRRIFRKPDTDVSRVLLAACYGHLGRIEEAKAAWREALRVNPQYSLDHKRRVLPYKNPADFEHIVEGLRLAGLPE